MMINTWNNKVIFHILIIIQCIPEIKETHKSSYFFWKLYWFIKKVYIVTNFSLSFLLTPDTRCIGHAWLSTNHFKWWCQNWFAQNRRFRANGVCHVSEQRDVLKRHSLPFLLSLLSCFFCLDSLFWHGLASLNLVISTQHHYSAQIDFDMHEFKLLLFSHALKYHVFGIKWKKRKWTW